MSKLGVLQIIDSLDTGGAEVMAVNIANLLNDKNINSHLCVTRKEGKLKKNIKNTIGYVFLNKKNTLDFAAVINLKKYIKKNDITIIHAHSSSFFIAFCVKILKPQVKIIWHDHFGKTQELHERKQFPLKQVSFFFTSIISVNKQLQNWSIKNLYSENVYLFNNFPFFNNFEEKTILKGKPTKRIIHLAAFRKQKDHENLLNAFEIFLKEHKDWSLHLVGALNNDEYEKKIIKLIKNKGLENHTFVYGSCLDIFNILKQATIGVLSSKSEGLPIALLEYGFAKLPVVVTNVGDCNKVITHKKTGFIVPPQNSILFAKQLSKMSASENLRIELAENLHNQVLKKYSSKAFIENLIKLYYN